MSKSLTLFNLFVQKMRQLVSHLKTGSLRNFVRLFVIGLSVSVAIAACSSINNTFLTSQTTQEQNVKLNLVSSFSLTQVAHDHIIPKFVDQWKQDHNQNVIFKQSYGGSNPKALLVAQGTEEADIVHLSLALDIQKLEKAGLIEPGWETEFPDNSIVTKSVIALVTREGNPKNIKTWNDLIQPGVTVITPNPTTSALGRWNFLALWNSAISTGATEEQALEFVAKVYKNAPILPESAHQATTTFVNNQGEGDVLLTYENELLFEDPKGTKQPETISQTQSYIIPDANFSIDNPVVIVDKNVDRHGTREVAEAFVEYLYSPEAQEEFAKLGYRPIDPSFVANKALTEQQPQVKNLATVKDYGGWTKIEQQFFGNDGIFVQVLKLSKSA